MRQQLAIRLMTLGWFGASPEGMNGRWGAREGRGTKPPLKPGGPPAVPLTVEDCGGAGGPLSCVSSLTAKSSSSLSSSSSASGLPSACTSVTGLQMQQTEYRIHTTFVDCYVRGKTPAQNAVIVSALSRMSEILRTWSEHVSTMRVESASRPGCLQRSLMPDGGWQWLLRTCTGPAGPTPLPSPTLLPPNKAAKSASSPVGPGGSPESFIVYIISHFSSWRQKCAAPWLERLADGLGSGLASQLRLVQWQCTAHLEAGREAAPRATGHCATLELAAAAASPEEPLAAVALVAHHYRRSAHAYVLLRQACRVKPIASGNYSAGSASVRASGAPRHNLPPWFAPARLRAGLPLH